MEESFAFDKPEVFPGGVDAFESEMFADFLKGWNGAFAPLVFLKEGVYLRLALSKPIHHKAEYCK